MKSSSTPLRLFVERVDRSGVWNMAFDEFLLRQALDQNQAAVRIYGWETATVSLGYFQKDNREVDARLTELPIVRRLSGGGAILHHHEITYSIALPKSHGLTNNPGQLYRVAHDVIVDHLIAANVSAQYRGEVEHRNDDPFLCFARQDPNDLVINNTKIVGSAQRRRRGAILQHGSILLKASSFVPELHGIEDINKSATNLTLDRQTLGQSMALELADDIEESALDSVEISVIGELFAQYDMSPSD
jgi:lipoyl(octanoyl) transferase